MKEYQGWVSPAKTDFPNSLGNVVRKMHSELVRSALEGPQTWTDTRKTSTQKVRGMGSVDVFGAGKQQIKGNCGIFAFRCGNRLRGKVTEKNCGDKLQGQTAGEGLRERTAREGTAGKSSGGKTTGKNLKDELWEGTVMMNCRDELQGRIAERNCKGRNCWEGLQGNERGKELQGKELRKELQVKTAGKGCGKK